MEVSHHIGVVTRAGALSMADEREGEVLKRRKVDSGELELSTSLNQLINHRRLVITPDIPVPPDNSTTRVFSSDRWSSSSWEQLSSSRCSSNGSCEIVNGILRSDVDPEGEGFQFENSTNFAGSRERRETTPSSDLSVESNELESIAMPSSEANSRRRSNAERMPSEAEIEGFFSAAQKEEHKRFTEKYNYDIVKDVPLEGRFEWVLVKP